MEKQNLMLEDLEKVARRALETHVMHKDVKEWFPCDIIPFEKVEEEIITDSATKSALYINGLTEDNLAHYTSTLKRLFGRDGAWGEWVNRWTWEESIHGRAIERYIDHIGVFDGQWLESARKAQLTSGLVPEPDTIAEIAIYTSIQEELTRIAHSRLGQRLQGVGHKLFALIAGDELRHHHFYNTIATAIRELSPDDFTNALHKVIKRFDMPGLGIPHYSEHAEEIEKAGIFTSQDVARTIGNITIKSWSIDKLADDNKSDESKIVLEKLLKRLEVYKRISNIVVKHSATDELKISWQDGRPVYNNQITRGGL